MVSNKFILLRERKDRLQFFAIKNNQIDRYFFEPFSPVFQIDDPDKTIKYDLSSGRSFDWNIGQSALGARTLQPSPPAGENSAVHVPNGLLRCIMSAFWGTFRTCRPARLNVCFRGQSRHVAELTIPGFMRRL
jgi:hypothetical protein